MPEILKFTRKLPDKVRINYAKIMTPGSGNPREWGGAKTSQTSFT
jgi:hypothetical protein